MLMSSVVVRSAVRGGGIVEESQAGRGVAVAILPALVAVGRVAPKRGFSVGIATVVVVAQPGALEGEVGVYIMGRIHRPLLARAAAACLAGLASSVAGA